MLEVGGEHPTIELFQPCISLNHIQTMKESKQVRQKLVFADDI